MKILAGLIASVLTSLILGACLSFAINKTIGNPDYIKQKAHDTQIFNEVSTIIAQQFAAGMEPGVSSKEVESLVLAIVTPSYIEKKTNSFLDQVKAHYQGAESSVPSLDISDLVTEAKKQGIDLPKEPFSKPFTIPAQTDKQIKETIKISQEIEYYSLIATGVLFLILFLICVKTHSYWPLVSLFVTSAALQAALYVLMLKGPDLLLVRFSLSKSEGGAVIDLVEKFSKAITADLASQFLVFTAVFGGAAFIALAFSLVSAVRYKNMPVGKKIATP